VGRVLFPHGDRSASRPAGRWRIDRAWQVFLLAIALAWLVGFLWPDLSATFRR